MNDERKDVDRVQSRDNFLHEASGMSFGHLQDEDWISFEGKRNCGKGMITSSFEETSESCIATTDGENFLHEKNDSRDEAKSESWTLTFVGSGLVIGNEIKVLDDEEHHSDGDAIEAVRSGGDGMVGRRDFQDEMTFILECGLMLRRDDSPEVKPADCCEHQMHCNSTSKFSKSEKEVTAMNAKNDHTHKHHSANERIETESIPDINVQMAFIRIIVDSHDKQVEHPKKNIETIGN